MTSTEVDFFFRYADGSFWFSGVVGWFKLKDADADHEAVVQLHGGHSRELNAQDFALFEKRFIRWLETNNMIL